MKKVKIIGLDTSQLPKFSGAEMKEMLIKLKNGDEKVKQKFLEGNFRLVLSIVRKFSNNNHSADDLFQVGCVGLLKAVKNFDISLDIQFSTYAVPMIIGEIRRFIRDQSHMRISRGIRDVAYKCLKVREHISKVEHRDATIDELSSWLNLPSRDIAFAMEAMIEPVSMFEPIFNDGDDNLKIMDQVSEGKNFEEKWMEDYAIKTAFGKLNEKEKQILTLRYYIGKTQMEVSEEVGISQAQVSRLEKSAIENIRKEF